MYMYEIKSFKYPQQKFASSPQIYWMIKYYEEAHIAHDLKACGWARFCGTVIICLKNLYPFLSIV